ncbi:MAG: DUF5615 family PIN-like protein [Bacteroidales bacterium]|nr:DUF5615 family PIN-like protein [Bacteroidales bacterium]
MKILCDVHIAIKVAKYFSERGLDTEHVNRILDKWNTSDSDVCIYADANNFTLITKDADFKNSHFINKTPKKLIKVNLGNITTKELISVFEKYFEKLVELYNNNEECYVEISCDGITIITDRK